jgi:hypothetical protein
MSYVLCIFAETSVSVNRILFTQHFFPIIGNSPQGFDYKDSLTILADYTMIDDYRLDFLMQVNFVSLGKKKHVH